MKKRLLTLLTILLPMVANADAVEINGINYDLSTNDKTAQVISKSDYYSGEVIIPAKVTYNGNEYSVISIGESAFFYCSRLTSVTIPNSVTSIGQSAFRDCSGLTSIVIPEGVTRIEFQTFWNCKSLTSISIPESVKYIGSSAFWGCIGLTSISIPNSVLSIGNGSFQNCISLTSVTIPNSVMDIGGYAFAGCSSLTSIIMPNNLKSISSHLFEGCSSITSIMIPDNVTYINNKAFSGCSSLISISIPNSVTSIDQYAFEGCSNLPSITIPNKVKKISSSTFSGCRSLISVSIPKSVTSIDQYAFSECSSLTSITIPSSVSEIQIPVFSGCSNLETIQVETDNNIYDSRNNSNAIIQTADNVLLIGCKNTVIPNSVTSISVSAFQDCKSLASIIIPNSVTSIGEKAFSGCSSLASLFIPNSMINIAQSAFWGCEGLEKIQVESDNKTFDSRDNCNAIIQTDYNLFLIGCKNSFIPKSVSVVGSYAFYNISCLNTITIPSSVTSIGSSAFWGCKLESVVCRSPKISLYNAFSSATYNHAVLYIPEGKRWETIYDGDWYQFINIRETAMDVNDLDPQTAYTLMNAETFQYTVYDPVNNQLKNIKDFHNVDESVANNSWQIVQADGQKYLYNIGARKFATMNTSNQWTLTDNPTPLSIMSDEDGRMTINGLDSKWFFVINEQTSVDQSVTAIGVVVENSDADENSYFTLEGKRIESPRKGLNIIRMNDGKVKKVMRK